MTTNSFGTRDRLTVGDTTYVVHRLDRIDGSRRLPYSLKVLLENLARNEDGQRVTADQVSALASWDPGAARGSEIAYTPARVLLQDFTGGSMRGRPGRHARCDGCLRRRPGENQPAHPGRAGHRPLGHR